MIDIIKQVIQFYIKTSKRPSIEDLTINDRSMIIKKGNCFVTIFLNGEVRGSAGNIKEIMGSLAEEIIENTVGAIAEDSRFKALGIEDIENIKIRGDIIESRSIISKSQQEKEMGISVLAQVDPIKNGIITIKKDYSKTATILPNIDSKIIVGSDYLGIIGGKLGESFNEDEYIIYKITTQIEYDS